MQLGPPQSASCTTKTGMPQGKKDLSSGPKKERYARKPEEERHAFHTLIAPKSTVAASSTNQGYVAILPTIRKNAQMIAAGKLAANGSVLRTGELARLADEQIKLLAKKRQQVRHRGAFLLAGRGLDFQCRKGPTHERERGGGSSLG